MKIRSILFLLLCLCLLAGAALAVEVETINVSAMTKQNSAPVAQNLSLCTYRGVSVGGTFQAIDPEGDLLSFRVTTQPSKGSVSVDGSSFVYTPKYGKRGRDSFTYQAVDPEGGASPDATVTIQIDRQSTDVFYPDLRGSGREYAAVRLAEDGVFLGEKIGGSYCFSAGRLLTRSDFLTMCAALTGMQPLEDVTKTGFCDDSTIGDWQKPYVSAALLNGVIRGSTADNGQAVFRGDAAITRAEAAVMLNGFLEITDAAGVSGADDVPVWAAQAVANLCACDICAAADFRGGGELTRGEAAEMLSAARDVLDTRGKSSRLTWAAR